MAEAKSINVGDEVLHYGVYRLVTGKREVDGKVVLVIAEAGGVEVERIEAPKTNLPVRDED